MTTVTLTDYATQTTWPPSGTATTITIYASKVSDAWGKQFKVNFPKPLTKSKYGTTEQRRLGDLKLITHLITVEGSIKADSIAGSADTFTAVQGLINTVRGGGFALLKISGIYSTGDITDGVDGIWVNFNRMRWMLSANDENTPTHIDVTLEMIHARSI